METQQGMVLAPPEYASPEQLDPTLGGGDLDTRTDIYSLGAVLYEMLAGEPPIAREELLGATLAQLQQRIRQDPPPRPSTRALTRGDPATARHLRGDLDWIVGRAMEKDRDRRYDSAAELAADLRRHLRREPVLAGPPSTVYRLRRFASRYRGPLAAAAAVFVALVLGLALAIAGLIEAKRQTKEAKDQAETSSAVLTFLNEDMLKGVDPRLTRGRDVTMKEALASAASLVGARFSGKPLAEAATRLSIGLMQRRLGRNDLAIPHLERAVEFRRAALGPRHAQTLEAMASLAWVYDEQGDTARAELLFKSVLEERTKSLGPDHPDTLRAMLDLGILRVTQGKQVQPDLAAPDTPERARLWDEAEQLHHRVMDARRRSLGPAHSDTLLAANNLAYLETLRQRWDLAAAHAEEAVAGATKAFGEDDVWTMLFTNTLGLVRMGQDRDAEAEQIHLKNLANRRRVLGDDHPDTLSSLWNLARVYTKEGRPAEAIPLVEKVLDARRRLLGDDHADTRRAAQELQALRGPQQK
jgi:non-specific serine/threonine protein kinase/serine/threonine-protein kinase